MKMIVENVSVPLRGRNIAIQLQVEPQGETLPFITIEVSGGTLDVFRGHHTVTGTIAYHFFRSSAMEEHKKQLMAHGLSSEQVNRVEAAGFNLAALIEVLTKYGPQALQILLALLATLKPAPTF